MSWTQKNELEKKQLVLMM